MMVDGSCGRRKGKWAAIYGEARSAIAFGADFWRSLTPPGDNSASGARRVRRGRRLSRLGMKAWRASHRRLPGLAGCRGIDED